MYFLLIIACFIGIYDGLQRIHLVKNGLKSGISPSKNLASFLFFDQIDQ